MSHSFGIAIESLVALAGAEDRLLAVLNSS